MTPAIRLLEKAKVTFKVHEYHHDPAADSFGDETVAALHVDPKRVFKTLIADVEGVGLVMGMVPVAGRLNLKSLAHAAHGKRAELADPAIAQRTTGYLVGGISPLAGKKALPIYMDDSAASHPTIFVSAGRRGMQLELSPQDLIRLTRATLAPLAVYE